MVVRVLEGLVVCVVVVVGVVVRVDVGDVVCEEVTLLVGEDVCDVV